MNTLNERSKYEINWLVNRMHISTSDKNILRDFYERMKDKNYPSELRKNVYRYAIECHHKNMNNYIWIMGSH